MDLKTLGTELAKIGLPLLGAALPIPGGMALGAALASQIGAPSADPSDILATLTGNAQALAQAKQFELTHQETMLNLAISGFQAESADRQNARATLSSKDALWWVAAIVLLTFAFVMIVVLYGSWKLLSGGITIKDVAVVAAISGLVGSIVGYVAANAQTVINFLFGGSMGNEKNSAALADSVRTSTQALAVGNNTPWTAAPLQTSNSVVPVVVAPIPAESAYAPVPGGQGEIYRGS